MGRAPIARPLEYCFFLFFFSFFGFFDGFCILGFNIFGINDVLADLHEDGVLSSLKSKWGITDHVSDQVDEEAAVVMNPDSQSDETANLPDSRQGKE